MEQPLEKSCQRRSIYIYIEKDMSYPSHKPWNTTNIHRSCKSKFHHGTAKFLSSSHRWFAGRHSFASCWKPPLEPLVANRGWVPSCGAVQLLNGAEWCWWCWYADQRRVISNVKMNAIQTQDAPLLLRKDAHVPFPKELKGKIEADILPVHHYWPWTFEKGSPWVALKGKGC